MTLKPYFVPQGSDSFRTSLMAAPSKTVKTTAKHVRASSSKGTALGSKGSHLKGTPYNPKWGDMAIPVEIKPFFRRDVMGAEFDNPDNVDIRRAFIGADVLLHTASNRLIQNGKTGQTTAAKSYMELFAEIQTILANRT